MSVARLQRAAGNRAVRELLQRQRKGVSAGERGGADTHEEGSAEPGAAPTAPLLSGLGPLPGMPTIQLLAATDSPRLVIQRLCVRDAAPAGGEEAAGPGIGALMADMGNLAAQEQAGAGGAGAESAGAEQGPQAPPPAAAPTVDDPAKKPLLKRGSRGPAVVELQGRLNDKGVAEPALATDGIFGPLTQKAVIAFQSANALVPDGIVGPLTWGKLLEGKKEEPPDVDPLAGLPVEVVGHGASDGAVAAARKAAIELFGDLTDPSKAQLKTSKVALDVIPHDKNLTDLPEYAHLKGTKTFDGRIWDTVRGIRTTINGVIRFAVAEEDLVSVPGKKASYGEGFLAAHEGGHALQASSLTPAQAATLQALYTARIAETGKITPTTAKSAQTEKWLHPSWYSAANKEEYFGNSVSAYLGHPYTNGDEDKLMYNQSWLKTNDAGMYALLQTVFKH